jgi:hypothetical protein
MDAAEVVREAYRAHYRRLVTQVYGLTGDLAEAQAVMQEAFARVLARPRGLLAVQPRRARPLGRRLQGPVDRRQPAHPALTPNGSRPPKTAAAVLAWDRARGEPPLTRGARRTRRSCTYLGKMPDMGHDKCKIDGSGSRRPAGVPALRE